MDIESDFRRIMGLQWPEGSVSYQPSELASNEVHDSFVKAGLAPEQPAAFTPRTLQDFQSGGYQEQTFVPPGCRDEAFEAIRRRRMFDAGKEPAPGGKSDESWPMRYLPWGITAS
jgi:hypothetical protein